MCGLCGEIRFDGARASAAAVETMADAMAARGPDGAGVMARGPVALGHRRLSIIDLSERAAQPFADPQTGLAIVFNGCIYNHAELRAELEALGHRFASTGDTEVILRAWAQWGKAALGRLHGMFAFAIHERDSGRTVLARDRFGIKPLYLAASPGRLRFASTLPALLAAGDIDTGIDPVALHHYMSWHAVVPAPRTLLKGVAKLPPATLRVIEPDGGHSDEVYWRQRFGPLEGDAARAPRDWAALLLEALRTAVRRRMVADVPVGVLLSGGLDSSLIVGLLAEEGQRGLATYSIGFEAAHGEQGDEFVHSDAIAARFATDHHRIRIGSDEMRAHLPDAIAAMSEPMVSHDAIGFYLLSREVAKSVKVVQSGQGADEIFGGYHWHPPMAGAADPVAAYADAFFDRSHAELAAQLSPEYLSDRDESRAFVAAHFAEAGADDPVDKALRLDAGVMLVDDPVKRVDNMTMAWGLEARVPFLDHELAELAARMPAALKLADGGKGVLKAAGRTVIPASVIDRPKGYFPVPALKYLGGDTLAMVRGALTGEAARARGLFRRDWIDTLLAAPDEHITRLRGSMLWQAGALELWLQAQGIRP